MGDFRKSIHLFFDNILHFTHFPFSHSDWWVGHNSFGILSFVTASRMEWLPVGDVLMSVVQKVYHMHNKLFLMLLVLQNVVEFC